MSNLKDGSNAIASALDDICTGLKKPIYDDADMDAHAQSVEILKKFHHQLQETIDKEEKYIAEYITAQEEFIKRLKNRFNHMDHPLDKKFENTQENKSESIQECKSDSNHDVDDDGWSVVARRRKIQNHVSTKSKSKLLGSAIGQNPLASMIPTTVHELAPNVLIPSKSIKTPEECHDNPGMLCWDHVSRRFWFSLNGYAISFSMGNVWWTQQDLKRPIKTTEFDPEKYCRPEDKLNYYFPPEVEYNIPHPMSDQRNFTSIATFCPTSVEPDHPSLRISDRNTLREDIVRAKPSDIRYAADYHAHGLGALIAMHHIKSA
jgi:hypothetical protein